MANLTIPTIFKAVDKFSGPVDKMSKNVDSAVNRMERKMRKVSTTAFDISKKSALVGTAIAAPLLIFANSAIEFEDKMADVGKTTQLEGSKLEKFGDQILDLSTKTRSSIDELTSIAEIGGQLGIAEKDLLSFTQSANLFNVALGTDFSGGVEQAISQVGKIRSLFAETEGLNVADAINRIGSAINTLGAQGEATSANMTEFVLRVGGITEALRPTVQEAAALGALFEESAIGAEVASRGYSILLNTAAKNIDKFAEQMGIGTAEAEKLINADPTAFILQFTSSLKGLNATESANVLSDLALNADGVKRVISSLTDKTGRLSELQQISNTSFEDGTSLLEEYNTKNNTTAAQLEIAKNNMQALSITLGTTLLPLITDLIKSATPAINSFRDWAKANKPLVRSIANIAAKLAGVAFVISGLAFTVGLFTKAMSVARVASRLYNVAIGVTGALSGVANIAIGKSTLALKAYTITTKLAAAAQKAWNLITSLNPIIKITAGVIALGAAVAAWASSTKGATAEQKIANEVNNRALENTIDQRAELGVLFATLRKVEEGSTQYNRTLERLNEIQPGIVEKHNLQVKSLEAINAAEKELAASILERAKAEARAQLIRETSQKELELRLAAEQGAGGFGIEGAISQAQLQAADELAGQTDVLVNQQIDEQNARENRPLVSSRITTQESFTETQQDKKTEKIIVEFANAPEGLTATGGGNISFNTPSTGSTTGG